MAATSKGEVGTAVLDHITEFGVAVFAQRLGERQRLGGEAKRLDDLLFRHLDLGGEFGKGGRTAVLQLQAGTSLEASRVSPACTGRRMVRPVLAMPRVIA